MTIIKRTKYGAIVAPHSKIEHDWLLRNAVYAGNSTFIVDQDEVPQTNVIVPPEHFAVPPYLTYS